MISKVRSRRLEIVSFLSSTFQMLKDWRDFFNPVVDAMLAQSRPDPAASEDPKGDWRQAEVKSRQCRKGKAGPDL